MIDGLLVQLIEYLRRRGLIDLAPIDIGIALGPDILHDPLVLRAPSRELSSVHRERVAVLGVGHPTLPVPHLVLEKFLERLILVNGPRSGDAKARYPGPIACGRSRIYRRRVVTAANGIFLDGKGGFEGNLLTILVESRRIECLI